MLSAKRAAFGVSGRDVQPTLEPAWLLRQAVQAAGSFPVGSRWPQALSQVCEQLRVRGFVLATWPSCRGPRQPAVTELAVVPPTTTCSPSLNAWPARPRRAPSRHILAPTRIRAFHSVPSYANPRADLHTPHLIKPVSAAFLIEIGADFLIGINYPLT